MDQKTAQATSDMASALADKIISSLECTFREWLGKEEYAEARPMLAKLIDDELGGWTVKAEDYDRLASAARLLRSACKHRLPPSVYWSLDPELDKIDSVLSTNVRHEPDGGKAAPKPDTQPKYS